MIIRDKSGAVTITERFGRITDRGGLTGCAWFGAVPCLVLLGFGFIVAGVVSHDYPPMAACLIVLVIVLAWLCVRLARMSVRFDESGVTIRNFWRTRRLRWGQVSHLADGGIGWEWALRVVGRDGRTVTASGSRSHVIYETRTVKSETLTAIGEAAERYGVSLDITGRVPVPLVVDGRGRRRPGNTRNAADGTAIIYGNKDVGLSADDDGITVRRGRRVERFGLDEISCFRNRLAIGLGLEIVLRAGRTIHVPALIELTDGELAEAIGQLALHHDVHADLTGPPPRPAGTGVYQDPWGEAGVRYWDGKCWSPLLPRSVARRAKPAEGSWSQLPVAEGAWTHAADQAKLIGKISAAVTAAAAAFVAVGLTVELVWDRGAHPRHWSEAVWFGAAASLAPTLAQAWLGYRWYRKLDIAARDFAARGKSPAA